MSVCLYAINHTITTHYLLGNLKKKSAWRNSYKYSEQC